MTEEHARSVTIAVSRQWDGALLRTRHLQPQGSVAALLNYTVDPWPVDGGMPAVVAEIFARSLPRFGTLAGRWFDRAPPGGDARFLPARPDLLHRLIRRVTGHCPADLVLTAAPTVVAELLDQGWDTQCQILLVLDPDCEVAVTHALTALRTLDDWDQYALAPPVRALIAPGVDGDYAMLAADSAQNLDAMIGMIAAECMAAGFQMKLIPGAP
jgi:hypothetical protein